MIAHRRVASNRGRKRSARVPRLNASGVTGRSSAVHAAGGTDGRFTFQAVHHRKDRRILARQGSDVADGTGQMVVFQGHDDQVGGCCGIVRMNDRDFDRFPVDDQPVLRLAFASFATGHKHCVECIDGVKHGGIGAAHGARTQDGDSFGGGHVQTFSY